MVIEIATFFAICSQSYDNVIKDIGCKGMGSLLNKFLLRKAFCSRHSLPPPGWLTLHLLWCNEEQIFFGQSIPML